MAKGQHPRRTSGTFYCQPSNVAIHHGLAMSAETIRCQKSYCREREMVVVAEEERVNHGKKWTGHLLSSLLRIAYARS